MNPMNKLLIALLAGTFALGSVAALADDKTPAQPVDQQKLKEERMKAKEAKKNQTAEQKKAKAAERQKQLNTTSGSQQEGGASPQAKAAEGSMAAKESKSQPKALPDKAAKQKALTEQEKGSKGAGGQ
jgi:hypothetical protein